MRPSSPVSTKIAELPHRRVVLEGVAHAEDDAHTVRDLGEQARIERRGSEGLLDKDALPRSHRRKRQRRMRFGRRGDDARVDVLERVLESLERP